MPESIQVFQSELAQSPEMIDRFFKNGKFNLGALVEGAEELGYEITAEDLENYRHDKTLLGKFSFLVPCLGNGGIKELTIDELEMVAAGKDSPGVSPDYANITVTIAMIAIATVATTATTNAYISIVVL